MTPAEALANLDHVASQVPGNRADHIRIQQSTEVLQAALARLAQLEPAEAVEP